MEEKRIACFFSSLPEPVKDTFSTLYNNYYSQKDYVIPSFVSLDTNYVFENIGYFTMDSKKMIIPFGKYFKLNKQKLFIDYSEYRTPVVYFDSCFYYPSGQFSVKKNRLTKDDYSDFENEYLLKYHLKDKWLR